MKATKFLIIDDHPLTLQGLKSIIESREGYEVVAAIDTPVNLEEIIHNFTFDIAIVDLMIADKNGADVCEYIKSLKENVKTMLMTGFESYQVFFQLDNINVDGIILKSTANEVTLNGIEQVLNGKRYIDASLIQSPNMAKMLLLRESLNKLTDREEEICGYIAAGISNVQISKQLFLSTKTVEKHKENIKIKLSANSQTELSMLCRQYQELFPKPEVG